MKNLEIPYKGFYFNSKFHAIKNFDDQWEVRSPSNLEDTVMRVSSNKSLLKEVCVAAHKASTLWKYKSLEERIGYMEKVKALFVKNVDVIAKVIARETGKPLWESTGEAKALASKITVTIEHSLKLVRTEKIENILPQVTGLTQFKPQGVLAVIGPFNFPAHLANGHIIPALLTGNTVIFKPSEKTPATAQILTEMFHQAGLPQGVFNLVQGQAQLSQSLVEHELVDGVLFTGSYDVGLKIKKQLLNHPSKILALEMGGKNSSLVWKDTNIKKAVYENIVASFITSGQRCSCTSQIFIHESVYDKFTEAFIKGIANIKIGHWADPVFMGPLIDQQAVSRHLSAQKQAVAEGGELLLQGKALELQHKGHYVGPAVFGFSEYKKTSVYQNSEWFSPQVSLYKVKDFDQASFIINSSGFGLVASLFSNDEVLHNKAFLDWKVGLLNINRATTGASSRLPFGGLGKSGNHRPSAHFSVQYCTTPVALLKSDDSFLGSNMTGFSF
ncbi:MAG: aldehyde dehydrogenase family protein [Bdellovibrionaceae bacterium]|nr:aldehyde dehydrogenase family protein [Pseudobdellovibrionaceae bacterium]